MVSSMQVLRVSLTLGSTFGILTTCHAFIAPPGGVSPLFMATSKRTTKASKATTPLPPLNMFFADFEEKEEEETSPPPSTTPEATTTATTITSAPVSASSDIRIQPIQGDDSSIQKATAFMVDSFWLNSPQQLIQQQQDTGSIDSVTDAARSALCTAQGQDLIEKYGERLGSRLMDSCLFIATSSTTTSPDEILGMVGIEVCLLDKGTEQIVPANKAESMVKNAVASLGPKQRREYKGAHVEILITELLPPQFTPACVLSNLAVSPTARRQGIAQKLCDETERLVRDVWGYEDLYLKVERDNTAARYLYEQKLGYTELYTNKDAVALRVDPEVGAFVEIAADTLILSKNIV